MDIKLETKKRSITFTFLIIIVSFLAMIKVLCLRFLFGKSVKEIRENYYGSFFIDRFSSIGQHMRINAASWRALDDIYNYDEKAKKLKGLDLFLTNYYMKLNNARALRNRARILSNFLIKDIKSRLQSNLEVSILSIASGSAQPVYEAIGVFSTEEQKKIKLSLLDIDPSAIDFSRELQKKYYIVSEIKRFNNSTSDLENLFAPNSFDIIEMAGFLDYRSDEKSIQLIKKLIKLMNKGGLFATCNIYPNIEKFFFDWLMLWPMIYRDKRRFEEILLKAGFKKGNINSIIEPLKVHVLSFCKK